MQHLQPNSTLQGGKYKIEKVLGQGGFGITYLAEHCMLGGKVAVKEFFMKELCNRDEATSYVTIVREGSREIVSRIREKFLEDARNIAKLNHPNIVHIIDVFEENGTAYYVMEYIEGESVGDMVKRSGSLPENVGIEYIKKIAEGLGYSHLNGIMHSNVSPENILIRKEDNQPLLVDFDNSRLINLYYDFLNSNMIWGNIPFSPSMYKAPELYITSLQNITPATDVYSLGASLYNLLTGQIPPLPIDVIDDGMPERPTQISPELYYVIEKTMSPNRKLRPQSTEEFLNIIDNRKEIYNLERKNSSIFGVIKTSLMITIGIIAVLIALVLVTKCYI